MVSMSPKTRVRSLVRATAICWGLEGGSGSFAFGLNFVQNDADCGGRFPLPPLLRMANRLRRDEG